MTAIARRVLALVAAGACVFAWDGYAQNYPLKTIALSCRSSPADRPTSRRAGRRSS